MVSLRPSLNLANPRDGEDNFRDLVDLQDGDWEQVVEDGRDLLSAVVGTLVCQHCASLTPRQCDVRGSAEHS